MMNDQPPTIWATNHEKFWPKKPVRKLEGQEHRGDDGQLLHDHVEPVGHRGQMGVHDPAQQVAVLVHRVTDVDQVVIDVPHVAEPVLRDPR